jgi:transcriptional regulator with XRE-family HTH domain
MPPRSSVGTHIGEQIRRLRSQRGIPQQVLAELAGFSPSTFKRIEAGRTPTVDEIDAIAAALGVTRRVLLPDSDSPVRSLVAQKYEDMTHRRQFSIGAAALMTTAVADTSLGWLTGVDDHVDAVRRLAHALSGGGPDAVTLDYLDGRFADYWQDYHVTKLPASELLPYAFEDLNKVSALLEGSLSPSTRTRLNAIAARAATVVGGRATACGWV